MPHGAVLLKHFVVAFHKSKAAFSLPSPQPLPYSHPLELLMMQVPAVPTCPVALDQAVITSLRC